MAIIPSDEKVFMVSNSTNTTYSGSAALKAMQQWYTMQDVIDTVGGGGGGTNYKSYVALISQSGTNDPVATVVYNDTGATFAWGYDDVGSYYATCSEGILLSGKTVVFVTAQGNPGNGQNKLFGGTRLNNSTVALNAESNGILDLNYEVRIYN